MGVAYLSPNTQTMIGVQAASYSEGGLTSSREGGG